MRRATQLICLAIGLAGLSLANPNEAQGQVAVVGIQPVAPAVVGYTAERRGLFGRRVVYRPLVAPVAVAAPVVAAPVVAARPVITAPTVVAARPVVVARPVTYGYPTVAPVASYYAPPVIAPVTTYPVPVPTFVPVIGY